MDLPILPPRAMDSPDIVGEFLGTPDASTGFLSDGLDMLFDRRKMSIEPGDAGTASRPDTPVGANLLCEHFRLDSRGMPVAVPTAQQWIP